MYRVTTASGHSVVATDDHSLATVGTDGLFSPLPPQEALGSVVPICYGSPFLRPISRDELDVLDDLVEGDIGTLTPAMLDIHPEYLHTMLDMYRSRHGNVIHYQDECQKALLCAFASFARFVYCVCDGYILLEPNTQQLVPEDGVLVAATMARRTNPYLQLPYTWSPVVDVEEVPREDITYDFTVPGEPMFVGNMILVYDTMQVHVPISEEAKQEALTKMMPSKNLFYVRTGAPAMVPQQESIFGLFKASTPAPGASENLFSAADAKAKIDSGEWKPNHPVMFKGKKTTAGVVLINDLLPEDLRDYAAVWDKKKVIGVLSRIGKSHPAQYTHVADGLKEYGANFGYLMGASFAAKDFDLDDLKRTRNKKFDEIEKELRAAKSYDQKVKILRKAQELSQSLTDNAKGNAFHQWAYSGSKGDPSQAMQIISSPTVVADPKDRMIPLLIRKSYNEGLSAADYWVSSYGTRKGTVGAKLSVAPAGMMTKELVGNTVDIVITTKDCGTKEGVEYPLTDAADLLDRYEAGTNRHVDARVIEEARRAGKTKLKVRSPIKCRARNGVCQMCYGHNENGHLPDIGANVGVVSAEAITEPLTQMGLNAKHTAGTAAADKVGLSTVQRFFTMPNQYSGAAVVAQNTGKITRVENAPAGGVDIYVATKKYHIAPGRNVIVKLGDEVEAGDLLSDGIPNLSKIVPHKGIDYGRELFVSAASDLYSRAKATSLKKNFEVVARGLVNYVEIDDPGDFDYIVGDVVDWNELQADIRENPGKLKPKFHVIQKGTTYAPQDKPDWLANFGFKYLKRTLLDNAATGAVSPYHSYHPVGAYATAKDFGKTRDGKY
jgi:DNA-directed RNA polymerase subunit beta'